MGYVGWALLAMITYGTAAIFLKLAFRGITPGTALIVANIFVIGAGIIWSYASGVPIQRQLGFNQPTLYLLLAGALLGVSISSYYKALSLGSASVVVPIFALSFTVAAILGFLVLGEPLKLTRILGLVFAAAAIVLLTR
ncbi:MAG: EamA family transporter [Dehalococcoidia bacterium]